MVKLLPRDMFILEGFLKLSGVSVGPILLSGTGACRKRQRTAALQNASACLQAINSDRAWSARVLCRFCCLGELLESEMLLFQFQRRSAWKVSQEAAAFGLTFAVFIFS